MKIANFSTLSVFVLLMSAPVAMGQADPDIVATLFGAVALFVNLANDIAGPIANIVGIEFNISVTAILGTVLNILNAVGIPVPDFDAAVDLICDPLKEEVASIGANIGATCTCEKVDVSDSVSIGIRVKCETDATVCVSEIPNNFCGPVSSDVILNLNLAEQDIGGQNFVIGTDQAEFCITEETSENILCVDFPLKASVTDGDFAGAALSVDSGTTATMTVGDVDTECPEPTVPCVDTDPLTVQIDCTEAGGPKTTCKTLFFEDASRRALSGNSKMHLDTLLNSIAGGIN